MSLFSQNRATKEEQEILAMVETTKSWCQIAKTVGKSTPFVMKVAKKYGVKEVHEDYRSEQSQNPKNFIDGPKAIKTLSDYKAIKNGKPRYSIADICRRNNVSAAFVSKVAWAEKARNPLFEKRRDEIDRVRTYKNNLCEQIGMRGAQALVCYERAEAEVKSVMKK